MKQQDKLRTKIDVMDFIEAYISFRGGMSNRIDARDIMNFLEGRYKRYYKAILKHSEEMESVGR